MRRHRNSEEARVIRLLDQFVREHDLNITKPEDQNAVLQVLQEAISRAPRKDILVHGTRVEAMFSYVAGALGHCQAIKQEDAGDFYSVGTDIAIPDFRVVTLDGEELFVEVKNCHRVGTKYRYTIKDDYLAKLRNYADLFACDLKFAIYWSQHNLWSLVSADAFELDDGRCSLSMEQCMKRNEMKIFGDSMVGTTPPLTLDVIPALDKPRNVQSHGRVEFTVGELHLGCGGRRIENTSERQLAWFFFSYGDWDVAKPILETEAGQLTRVRFVAEKEHIEGQDFAMLGFLSQMISLQFNELTAEEGEIVRLSPTLDPDKLGIAIPPDYKGDNLRLWRFAMSPNYD